VPALFTPEGVHARRRRHARAQPLGVRWPVQHRRLIGRFETVALLAPSFLHSCILHSRPQFGVRQLLNTLYVTTEGSYLHLDHDTVRMEVDGETKAQVPLHHLGAVVGFGNVLVSPALIARCAEDGRSVVFMTRSGRFRARMVGPQTGNVLLRKAQHEQSEDQRATREIARTLVAGKIKNGRRLVVRAARRTDTESEKEALERAKDRLARALSGLEEEETLEGVRGQEGTAARVYFEVFSYLLRQQREAFEFTNRTRRPPRDRLNAVLSFLYTLLCNDCEAAAEGVGLDPQIGFLHAPRPGRPSLGLDLMEELRAPLADRLALTLINRRQLAPEDFREPEGGAVLLNEEGRETVLVAYQKRKEDTITHPILDQEIELGLLPHAQARILARHLRGELDRYVPYLLR